VAHRHAPVKIDDVRGVRQSPVFYIYIGSASRSARVRRSPWATRPGPLTATGR